MISLTDVHHHSPQPDAPASSHSPIDDPATSAPVPDWKDTFNDRLLSSALVSANLKALGALSVDTFLSPVSASLDAYSSAYPIPSTLLIHNAEPLLSRHSDDDTKPNKSTESVARKLSPVQILHQACQRAFGRSDTMTFEFLEDSPNNKQCILTITRPNGSVRVYKTEPAFVRKNDAKLKAAEIAIEMGAADFIITGETEAHRGGNNVLLTSLDDSDAMEADRAAHDTPQEDSLVKGIEECCNEWRAGKVKPHWVMINDARAGNKYGAALRISLTQHAFRVYSAECKYTIAKAAKDACAQAAVDEGVLEYIKYGNGQTSPASADEHANSNSMNSCIPPPPPPITLRSFYETLPQPFPEDVGHKTATEINALMWLNTMIQSARGSQLKHAFTSITNDTQGLQGCLLRLERPTETRSYLVDPLFAKRSDARAAVCLLAMSQGVGNYIRNVKTEADSKFPPKRRKFAFEKVIPLINRHCLKIRPGNRPDYDFKQEKDGFGCTLKIDISPSTQSCDIREYTVPVEYAHKADAKAAVACLAVEQGLIELIRFRGEAPPADHIPVWDLLCGSGEGSFNKRKVIEPEVDVEARDAKKRKKGVKLVSEDGQVEEDILPSRVVRDDIPVTPPKPRIRKRVHSLPTKPVGHDVSYANSAPKPKVQHYSGKNVNPTSQSPPQPFPLHTNDPPPPPQFPTYEQPVQHKPVYATPQTPIMGPYVSGYHHIPPPVAYAYGPFIHYPHTPPVHIHYPPQPQPHPYSPYYSPQALPPTTVPVPHYGYPPSPISPYPPYPHVHSHTHFAHPHPQILYPTNTLMPPHPTGLHPVPYPPGYVSPHAFHEPQLSRSPTWNGLPSPQTPLRLDERSPASSRMLSPISDISYQLEADSGSSSARSSAPRRCYGEEQESNLTLNYGESDIGDTQPTQTPSKPKVDVRRPQRDVRRNGKKRATPEYVPTSNVAELLAFCFRQNIPQPQFYDEKQGSKHKVWVIHGAERLELPITFNSISEGRERIAKQTLQRLRSRFKKTT